MPKLADHFVPGRPALSFEFFPPKTAAGDEALMRHVQALLAHRPNFVTCTYGAGGSTRQKTLDVVQQVKSKWGIPVASHLTCVASTLEDLRAYLRDAQARNVDYIVALRGDPPQGESAFQQTAGGLRYANELVCLIRNEFPHFGVAVAGYPEVHQEATSAAVDLANLKHKVDCGADVVITQLFFDNSDFFRFRDHCREAGIHVPVVAGLLPVTNLSQIQRITSLCKAKLPERLIARLSQHDDPEWQLQVGVDHAVEQTQGLLDAGVDGLHYYVLNKSQATATVLDAVAFHQRRGAPVDSSLADQACPAEHPKL